MPTYTDEKGKTKFHMNPQMGKHLSGGKSSEKKEESHSSGTESAHGNKEVTLHEHGDGTYHTSHAEGETQHPDLGHALTHMGHHMEGGKHAHIHHDGVAHHFHGVHESGEHEGTHDAQNLDELQGNLHQFFNEEKQEGSGDSGESSYSSPSDGSSSNVADLLS